MNFIELSKRIDALIIYPSKGHIAEVLSLLREDKDLCDYFFKKVDSMIWFEVLAREGYFSAQNNPAPIESTDRKGSFAIPSWPPLPYLEKVSKESTKPENRKYAEALMDILREVTMPGGDPGSRTDNYRTWYSFIKIMANLPTDVITMADIDLIVYWLDSKFENGLVEHEIGKGLLPKLLGSGKSEDGQKAARIVEIVTNPARQGLVKLDFDDLDNLFKRNAENLGKRCGEKVVWILQSRLESEQVLSQKDDVYSYIWRAAVEDHAQNSGTRKPRHALIRGLRDVLMAYAHEQDAQTLLDELWRSPRFMVRRIAMYVISGYFQKYQDFSLKLMTDNVPGLFLEHNYHHEFYGLIVSHFTKFPQEVQNSLIKIISDLKGDWRNDIPLEEQADLNRHMQWRWFYAIKQSGYSLPKELETKYDLKKYQPEHPEFLSYRGPVTWGTEQLFSVGDLMAKGSVKDIVTFLNDFKDKNRFNEIGYEEAGQVLKEAVKANQEFFEMDIAEFLRSNIPSYQYYLFRAFDELWNEKKPINWEKILNFSWQLIYQDNFWDTEAPEPKRIGIRIGKDWIPSAIANLIDKGVKNDEWVMPDDGSPDVRRILERLLDKIEPTAKGTDSDALTEAINSPKGHAIQTFIDYALWQCRIYERDCQDKGVNERKEFWKTLEPLFERELKRAKNTNFEFSALGGTYLPNLYYLSKEWVEKNINRIFPVEPEYEKNWRCAVSGYSYVHTVYEVIYRLLKDNGHLKRVLKTSFKNSNIREQIIGNIAVSYLRGDEGFELLNNSLMLNILNTWEQLDISSIINLFWSHREVEFKNNEKERIFSFWNYCYRYIQKNPSAHSDILSDLCLLTVFLDKIDSEQKERLLQCAPYADKRHHSSFFLEYLDKLADVNPKEVGEIFVAMIQETPPLYQEENIRSIVEKLYKLNEKVSATRICDRYARQGYEFLRDLYDKYIQQ